MTSEASPAAGPDAPAAPALPARAVLRQQLVQLEGLRDAGVLDEASFKQSRERLEQRLAEAPEDPAADPVPKGEGGASAAENARPARWRFPALMAIVALVAGGTGYLLTGQPASLFGTVKPVEPEAAAPSPAPQAPVALPLDRLAERLAQRLKNEPNDVDGWVLLGRSYVSLGRQAEAVTAFKQALSLRPSDADAKAALAEAQAALAAAPALGSLPTPANPGGATGASVSGIVTLSPDLLKGVKPEDTVFVFARRADGSRMPLAIQRHQVKDLPLRFELDDTHSMSGADRLSAATQVVISARVSPSGQASPQPGDLEGSSGSVNVGQRNVLLEISRRLP